MPEAILPLVSRLFENFVGFGFRYDLRLEGPLFLLDREYGAESNGNCAAYAEAFAGILNAFGIEARRRWIRPENSGRFIVKLSQFIDPSVRGNIYANDALMPGYYVFNGHAATWVPALNEYYDPMAKAHYQSLDPFIECELAGSGDVYVPKKQAKTLFPGRKWRLSRTDHELPGAFNRLNLEFTED